MTAPGDVTSSDTDPAGDAPAAIPPPAAPLPSDAPAEPDVDMAALAAAGVLTGPDLAAHLGADDLEAHASAMAAQGVQDGTEAPAGVDQADPHTTALAAWIAKPTFTAADPTKLQLCGLCGVAVGPDHDWHTEQHRRGG